VQNNSINKERQPKKEVKTSARVRIQLSPHRISLNHWHSAGFMFYETSGEGLGEGNVRGIRI